MSPTIRDVAIKSGVSISTVSRVMNNPNSVKEDKRNKVLDAIKQLNYSPNALARGLIYKKTQTIGALIPDISNPYASEVILGLEDAANRLNLNLILCNTNRNEQRTLKYLKILKEKQVDGIIMTSDSILQSYIDFININNLPIVLASTEGFIQKFPSVRINDVKASYDAADFLISRNHKILAMISGPLGDPIAGKSRYDGFMKRIKEDKIDSVLVETGDFRFEDGYNAMKKLLLRNSDITAIFTASDEMAVGAITYLHEIGLRVPDDISVIGFDNTKISRMFIPKLTTVGQPMYDIGVLAVEKLNLLLEGEPVNNQTYYLPHRIIERESVRILPK